MKKVLAILLALITLAMGAFLVACDEEDDPDKGNENQEENNEPNGDNSQNENNPNNNGSTEGGSQTKKPSEGLEYELNDDESGYIVTGIGTCTDTEIVIPDEYNGKSVVGIGDSPFHSYQYSYDYLEITSVTIPNSVTSIGEDAFEYCYKLVEVVNNSSLSITAGSWDNGYVGYYALEVHTGESKLVNQDGYLFYTYNGTNYLLGYTGTDTALNLPDNYNGENYEIYKYAFCCNNKITNIEIPDSVTSIGEGAFVVCTKLKSVNVPDSVTSIGDETFYGCTGLKSITIPDSVTSIGYSAFEGCTGLTSITIGNSVTSIGYSAFEGCEGLTSITIPDSVTSIGSSAFNGCTGLTSVTIGNSVTRIGDGAFYNTSYYNNKANWENKVLYIGKYLINAKEDISGSYSIKDGTLCIADSAFSGCTGLTSVTIGNGVTSIGNYAFYGCLGLTSITIHDSVTSIGDSAFYACRLKNINIPNSVTSIGARAFSGCIGLTSVSIPDSVTIIGYEVFEDCTGLTSINVSSKNTKYKSIDGNLYSNDGKTLIQYACGKKDTSFTIPNGVISIDSYAFKGCTGLTSITIPDGVTSIYHWVFRGCTGLTSITIPNSVTSIGARAFSGCTGLKNIYYTGTQEQWNAISKGNSWNYNTGDYTVTYNYTE